MLEQLATEYNALDSRVRQLEVNSMPSLTDLQLQYAALSARVDALELPVESSRNSHFDSLLNHPLLILSRSMREPSHTLSTRGGVRANNPNAYFDQVLDATRQVLAPFLNEIPNGFGLQYSWQQPSWDVGDRIVIQVDMLVSKALKDLVTVPGVDGRIAAAYKHLNICVDGSNIMYETVLKFTRFVDQSEIAFRAYRHALEGRMGEATRWAAWGSDPTRNAPHAGGSDWDEHPGPDSTQRYLNTLPHPQCFRAVSDRWVAYTYQLDRVPEGTRVKIWVADEQSENSTLVMASPSNPSIGFLINSTGRPTAFYFEMDTSQGSSYTTNMNETPLGERYCAFRNFMVFRGAEIAGEDILHIPKR